jgi:IS605 OrfB family transposase
VTESTLTERDGNYYLHLGFRKPKLDADESPAEDRTVLGVDLGMENLAVTGTAHFESGQELLQEHREFERVRGGLQETGTESAHRTLVQRDDREERYNRDYLHRVSNRLLAEAIAYDCTHIAFEDLTHIRDSVPSKRKFHQWAHAQLVKYVEYKAESSASKSCTLTLRTRRSGVTSADIRAMATAQNGISSSVRSVVQRRMRNIMQRRTLDGGLSVAGYMTHGGRATVNLP